MNQLWLNAGRILAVAAAMLLVGCGPSKAYREPGKTQSDADYKAEMAKQEAAMMGNQKPATPNQDKGPAEGKQETEKPKDEKPAEKEEAKK